MNLAPQLQFNRKMMSRELLFWSLFNYPLLVSYLLDPVAGVAHASSWCLFLTK